MERTRENRKVKRTDIQDCEYALTSAGWITCTAAGLAEELTVFLLLKIDLLQTPVPVFLVLWAAFGIMTSGLLTWMAAYRAGRAAAAYSSRTAEAYVDFRETASAFTGEYGYGCAAQKRAS